MTMSRLMVSVLSFVLGVVVLGFTSGQAMAAADATLKPGDAAPPLKVGKWVKGTPVEKFEPGTVYVLECWATWCGPCVQVIPHVTSLQKEHGDKVVVIGMNVWERDESQVEPFVTKMGDKMDYRVVMDDKSTHAEGAMATTWMKAAGRNGIPCSFIVDQKGRIAWIGHPATMDGVLAAVVAGTFDPIKQAEIDEKREAISAKLTAAVRAKDAAGAIAAIDEMAAADPMAASKVPMMKMGVLMHLGAYDEAYAQGDAAYEALKDDAMGLAQVAWGIVGNPRVTNRNLPLAKRFAERAVEVSERKNAFGLHVLARVAFEEKDAAKAVQLEQEAVNVATDAERPTLERTLREYQAAVPQVQ